MATKILLVEDNPGDARLIREMLTEAGAGSFEIRWVRRLAEALEEFSREDIDLVLLDLGLDDSHGLDTFLQANAHAPHLPFVVLSGLTDETVANKAVEEGAQDYLLKGETDGAQLLRSLRYATARKRIEEDLKKAREDLEERVAGRTAALAQANAQLRQEIEQRRRAEDELVQSRARYRAIFENTGTATTILDEEGRICLANTEFEHLSGYSRQEIEGQQNIEEFVVPKDLGPVREYLRLRRVHPASVPKDCEFRFKNRQGQVSHILLTVATIPGTLTSVASLLDITDRKNAETALKLARSDLELKVALRTAELARANAELLEEMEERRRAEQAREYERQRLFALLDGLPTFVYLKAPDYSIRFANRTFRELFGEGLGRKCYEALLGRQEPCADCRAFQVLKTNTPQTFEWAKPELARTFQIHNYPFIDIDGSPKVLTLGIDISTRLQTEEALRESEEKYRLLVNTIPAVIFQGYADGSIDFFDNKIENLTGYHKEEFDSRRLKWTDLILEEDLGEARLAFSRALKSDRTYVREYRIRHRDGGIVWVQGRGRIFLGPEGRIDHVRGVLFNVSLRKEAEEELQKSQARLANAQRLAQLGHWEWDLATGEVTWSGEIYRIFGVDPQQVRPSYEAALGFVHPEDWEQVSKSLAEALAGGKPYSSVNRIVRPDGTVRIVHSEAEVAFDEAGKPLRILGTAQDITERKEAEERLRATQERLQFLVSATPAVIYSCKAGGDYGATFISDNVAAQLGYSSAELLADSDFWINHLHPEDAPGILAALPRILEYGYHIHEYRFPHKDGGYRWLQDEMRLVRDAAGKPLEIVGSMIDITARKQAEEQLRESEKHLRYLASQLLNAQEQERKRISRELHDELGQSLLVLKMKIRSLERKLTNGPEASKQECKEVGQFLDLIVDEVRRLSRDLSPGLLEDLGLSTALRRLMEEFSKHYQLIEETEEMDLIDDLFPPEAQINIYRIFQESLTNIGKYANARRLTVKINREADGVSFMIADDGRGFDLAAVLKGEAPGRGLGLAAMEERVRMLGGDLEIWSQEGEGTRISFKVPTPRQEEVDLPRRTGVLN